MNQKLLLNTQTPYRHSLSHATPLQQLISLDSTQSDEYIVEAALGSNPPNIELSPSIALGMWRDLLAITLVLRTRFSFEKHLPQLLKRSRSLRAAAPYPENQLLTVYQAIISVLVGRPPEHFMIDQLDGGACPLEILGYSKSGEIPHPILQAELGVLLFLYSEITGSDHHLETAIRLVEWQKNTLDESCSPFTGLFSKEGEVAQWHLLIYNHLLFCVAARINKNQEFEKIANLLFQKIEKCDDVVLPPYFQVLTQAFPQGLESNRVEEDSASMDIQNHESSKILDGPICDVTLALAGFRSSGISALATLFGCASGMGCIQTPDIQIVSFGPQHMPLNDCNGFGIEGGRQLLGSQVRQVRATNTGFVVDGTMRMVESKNHVCLEAIWIDGCQKFADGVLDIEALFHGLPENYSLGFSFFVRCLQCKMEGEKTIRKRSLNRYQGQSTSLLLEGNSSSIEILAGQQHSEMHVIPLGGGVNFWDADFLISYILPPNEKRFCWKILKKLDERGGSVVS